MVDLAAIAACCRHRLGDSKSLVEVLGWISIVVVESHSYSRLRWSWCSQCRQWGFRAWPVGLGLGPERVLASVSVGARVDPKWWLGRWQSRGSDIAGRAAVGLGEEVGDWPGLESERFAAAASPALVARLVIVPIATELAESSHTACTLARVAPAKRVVAVRIEYFVASELDLATEAGGHSPGACWDHPAAAIAVEMRVGVVAHPVEFSLEIASVPEPHAQCRSSHS